jgi:hypothetical protein
MKDERKREEAKESVRCCFVCSKSHGLDRIIEDSI